MLFYSYYPLNLMFIVINPLHIQINLFPLLHSLFSLIIYYQIIIVIIVNLILIIHPKFLIILLIILIILHDFQFLFQLSLYLSLNLYWFNLNLLKFMPFNYELLYRVFQSFPQFLIYDLLNFFNKTLNKLIIYNSTLHLLFIILIIPL